eukprot:363371-Chlamydomonas_euryale.AAC.2
MCWLSTPLAFAGATRICAGCCAHIGGQDGGGRVSVPQRTASLRLGSSVTRPRGTHTEAAGVAACCSSMRELIHARDGAIACLLLCCWSGTVCGGCLCLRAAGLASCAAGTRACVLLA